MISISSLRDINAVNKLVRLQPPYKLVDFHPGLVRMIEPRGTDRLFFDLIPSFENVLQSFSNLGPAFVAVHKGKPICVFGCVPLWNGCAECWLVTDVSLPQHARAFHRVAKVLFTEFMSELCLFRLQFTIHHRNLTALKWAKTVYFKEEGRLLKYGPDQEDFFMYARTR